MENRRNLLIITVFLLWIIDIFISKKKGKGYPRNRMVIGDLNFFCQIFFLEIFTMYIHNKQNG